MGHEGVPHRAELLQQAVNAGCQGLRVVATGGTVGIALARQVGRDHLVLDGEPGHDLAPGIPALRKAREQHHGGPVRLPAGHVVQPHPLHRGEAVFETLQARLRPRGRRGFDKAVRLCCHAVVSLVPVANGAIGEDVTMWDILASDGLRPEGWIYAFPGRCSGKAVRSSAPTRHHSRRGEEYGVPGPHVAQTASPPSTRASREHDAGHKARS